MHDVTMVVAGSILLLLAFISFAFDFLSRGKVPRKRFPRAQKRRKQTFAKKREGFFTGCYNPDDDHDTA